LTKEERCVIIKLKIEKILIDKGEYKMDLIEEALKALPESNKYFDSGEEVMIKKAQVLAFLALVQEVRDIKNILDKKDET